MPLRLGSIFSEYTLELQGLRDGVTQGVLLFKELQTASSKTRASLQRTNDGILGDFKKLQAELSALKPFEPLIASGAKAYKALVGSSIIPDLTRQTMSLLTKMRSDIDRLNAFDPLTIDAARAAAESLKAIDTLEAKLEGKRIEVGTIGVSPDALRSVVDEAGQVRDEVLRTLRSGQSATNRPNDPGFGLTRDSVEQKRRIDALVAAAPSGTQLHTMGDDMNEFGQGMVVALQRASDLYAEINLLERQIRELRESAEGGGNAIGQAFLEAEEAAEGADLAMRKALEAEQRLGQNAGEISKANRQLELYARAGNGARISDERRGVAWDRAEEAEKILNSLERARVRLLEDVTHRTEQQQLAVERLSDAQQGLNRLLDEAEAQKRVDAGGPQATPTSGGKLFEEERKRQQKQADLQAEHERKLALQTAQIEQQAKIEADQRSADHQRKLELQAKQFALQNVQEIEKARIAAEVEVARARIAEEGKAERAREREASRAARNLRVARGGAGTLSGLSDDEKSTIERARAEKEFGDAVAAVDKRLQDQTLTLAQQNRLHAQRRRLLEDERIEQERQGRQAQRTLRLLLPVTRRARATSLDDEERSLIKRARAEHDYAAAVAVVDARLADQTLTLAQQNNLHAQRRNLLAEELDAQQRVAREAEKLARLLTPKRVRPLATGLSDDERSIIRRARAEGQFAKALEVVDDKLKEQNTTVAQTNNLFSLRRKIIEQGLRQQAQSERKAVQAANALKSQLKQTAGATGLTDVQQSLIKLARSEKEFAQAVAVVDTALENENLTLVEQNNLLAQRRRLLDENAAEGRKLAREQEKGTGVLGLLSASFTNLAGALGLATFGYEVISRTLRAVKDSFVMTAEVDQNRRTLGQMINNQDRANRALQEGIRFGRQFGFTQREMSEAARLLAPQMRISTVELSKQFEVLARLSARAPEQGIGGAAYALGELSAGDVQSIADRFNIPRRIANQMKREIQAGGDVFTVLDRTLTRLGLTAEVLGERMQGAQGAMNAVAVASDELKQSLGGIISGPGSSFLRWLADVEHQAALTLDGLRGVTLERARLAEGTPLVPPNELQKINQESLVARDASGLAGQLSLIFRPLELIPQLLRALGGQGQENIDRIANAAGKAGPRLTRMNDLISSATNRYTEGRTTLETYATELRRIGEENKVRALLPATDLDTIPELTAQLEEFQARAARETGFGVKELPRAIGLAQALAKLKALSPLELTVEMRTEQVEAAAATITGILDKVKETSTSIRDLDRAEHERTDNQFLEDSRAWSDHLRGLGRLKSDFDEQQRRSNADFDAQQQESRDAFRQGVARGDRDFNLQLAEQRQERGRSLQRDLRDFERQREREDRDNRRADEQAEKEHLESREEMREQAAERIVEIEDNARKQLLDLQAEYQIDATRAQEDYELERMVLLAEGRIAEARVLESRFSKERRRAAEDQARAGSDIVDDVDTSRQEVGDSLAEQLDEEQRQYEEQREETRRQRQQARDDADADRRLALEDARLDYERQRQQAIDERNKQKIDAQADFDAMVAANKAQHEQQIADAQAAYAQQETDLKDAWARQKVRQDYEQAQEVLRYKEQRKELLDSLAAYVADEKAKLEGNYNDIKRLEELKATVIDENEAKAIVALENSLKEMNRLIGAQEPLMYDSGVSNGLAWIQGWVDGLKNGAASAPAGVGGVIGNNNVTDDPRPSQSAITSIFGPAARVTSTYDSARPDSTGVHRGLDVTMIPGSRVPAPLPLMVRKVSKDQYGGGTTVLAIDAQGRQWLFAHMYNVPVKAGQPLAAGATMGFIGAEGHVHVQLRNADDASVPIDPSAALDDAARQAAGGGGTPSWLGGGSAQPGGSSGFGAQSLRRTSLQTQGYNDGRSYKTGLISGLQSRRLPGETLALNATLPPAGASTSGQTTSAPASILIRLQADVIMDGQKVGELVAPVVENHLANDLTIQARVVESNYTPGVYQTAFRRPI